MKNTNEILGKYIDKVLYNTIQTYTYEEVLNMLQDIRFELAVFEPKKR